MPIAIESISTEEYIKWVLLQTECNNWFIYNTRRFRFSILLNNNYFMTIGIWQILLILFITILFFGNLTNILKDLAKGINTFKLALKKKSKNV
jgi:hypothetical protein